MRLENKHFPKLIAKHYMLTAITIASCFIAPQVIDLAAERQGSFLASTSILIVAALM